MDLRRVQRGMKPAPFTYHRARNVEHAAFEEATAPPPLGRLLAEVARHIAHAPIRARGTFCGSLAHADPSAEWCVVAVTLDAELAAVSIKGERLIPARAFF